MINFKVDSISFYADRVDGHKERSFTTIYIYGLQKRDREIVKKAYLDKWHPAGYGTTIDFIGDQNPLKSYMRLERRNSCE